MIPRATFFRLLDIPTSEKGTRLRQQITDFNVAQPTRQVFSVDPVSFAAIPGSPFAYWVPNSVLELFLTHPRFEQHGRVARVGDHPGDQERFLRLFWEVPAKPHSEKRRWTAYQKGGAYSPYYADIHLVVDWDFERETFFDFHGRIGRSSEHPSNYHFFFRPGITWPRRTTSGISVRPLPKGCVFADKGPAAFVENNDNQQLMALMAVMNSTPFLSLIELQLGAADVAARSYEVGIIQQTPIPSILFQDYSELEKLALRAYYLIRESFQSIETTHVFCLPVILRDPGESLALRLRAIAQAEDEQQHSLAAVQAQIDACVTRLYAVPELASIDEQKILNESSKYREDVEAVLEEDDESEATSLLSDPYSLVSDFLMWCVGVVFGRWDMRYALNPETLPDLPEPFDLLPVCCPGMLQGKDGLPLDEAPKSYPLPIASCGFLVDDPDRPYDDIVAAVRRVFGLLWGENAESIENEACQILEVPDLRTWFRDSKGFFAWHIKRYSKSRRKAPIYWLIQSAKKNYSIWLYYPRFNPDSLFFAAREYADAKLNLETTRLEDLQSHLKSLSGANRKVQEKKLAAQTALVAELKSYIKALDAAALLQIKPDLNDGVLLNIAPLRELVPWKEPTRAWGELLRGKYAWSHIATHLRQKGFVKNA